MGSSNSATTTLVDLNRRRVLRQVRNLLPVGVLNRLFQTPSLPRLLLQKIVLTCAQTAHAPRLSTIAVRLTVVLQSLLNSAVVSALRPTPFVAPRLSTSVTVNASPFLSPAVLRQVKPVVPPALLSAPTVIVTLLVPKWYLKFLKSQLHPHLHLLRPQLQLQPQRQRTIVLLAPSASVEPLPK